MDQSLEKLITWLRNEFIILKRDLANYIIRKVGDNTDALNQVAKSQDRLASALEKQKILPLSVTHQVNIPEIKVPEAKVTVTIPDIKLPAFPKITIPDIKIPPIKLPTINVPKPEVTVNVEDREDKAAAKLLKEILTAIAKIKPFDLWEAVGKKTPLPVILVDESSKYYRAGGGGSDGPIVMSAGGVSPLKLNNTVFGSGSASVTTPGTPVQLPNIDCAEVTITANEANADVVTVGGANVVGAKATRVGTPLEPLTPMTIKINNLQKIYIDSVQANDGITFTYIA